MHSGKFGGDVSCLVGSVVVYWYLTQQVAVCFILLQIKCKFDEKMRTIKFFLLLRDWVAILNDTDPTISKYYDTFLLNFVLKKIC